MSSQGRKTHHLKIYFCLTSLGGPLLATENDEISNPASELAQPAIPPVGPSTYEPNEENNLPQIYSRNRPKSASSTWGFSIQMGQENFYSLAHVAIPFSQYMGAKLGWLIESTTHNRHYSITHAPTAVAYLRAQNLSVLTPTLSIGPAYFFSKQNTGTDEHRISSSGGLYASLGVDLLLTSNFALILQQRVLASHSNIFDINGKAEKSKVKNQMLFQFTF